MSREDTIELIQTLEELERREKAASIDCSALSREQANEIYLEILTEKNIPAIRHLCKTDLFFLLTKACKRKDIDRDWLYERCREVQANSDGHLDLWPRDHYKSTIITFGKTIQDILDNPENTIGIHSHTRPIAKAFLAQIMQEFEQNQFLKDHFKDVLFQNPRSEARKWSLDNGIIVKRKTNPKEATVEASGLVDGQPTGKHYDIQVYDDTVTRESVTTPEQIKKVQAAWELSLNLGSSKVRRRYIGTRYHTNDLYQTMISRGSVIVRKHTATKDGKADGEPVLLSKDALAEKRRDMGPYTFFTQMMNDPVADKSQGFKSEWRKYYEILGDTKNWNKYILVDPASKKKKSSDSTVFEVIGLAPDGNYYLLDAYKDKLNLTQRQKKLFELHRKWRPLNVGYEEYGMQADIEFMYYMMEQENYRFAIQAIGGQLAKEDRIKRLIPVYEQGRFYSPKRLIFVNSEGEVKDYVQMFEKEEYDTFPVSAHDDMIDCRSRILDPEFGAKFPAFQVQTSNEEYDSVGSSSSWMG